MKTSSEENQLCPCTMQRIEIALREQGFDVISSDLKGWQRTCTFEDSVDECVEFEYFEGRVRNLTIILVLESRRLSRAQIDEAIESLIEKGLVKRGKDGRLRAVS